MQSYLNQHSGLMQEMDIAIPKQFHIIEYKDEIRATTNSQFEAVGTQEVTVLNGQKEQGRRY